MEKTNTKTVTVSNKKNQINQRLFIPNDLTIKLRDEASKNPAFSAICHNFALRERSRSEITLTSLYKTMTKEGFNYDKGQYARAFRFLAALGIGDLYNDAKGRLRKLMHINVALQVIALAALSKDDSATRERPKLRAVPKAKIETKLQPQIPERNPLDDDMSKISITSRGRTVTIILPNEQATKYLVQIIADAKR